MKRLILSVIFLALSFELPAQERIYQADVEGMVCAFCAYSVSRDVAKLPGVDADSVDVDLQNGKVTFSSDEPVLEETVVSIFARTGFRVSGLRETDSGTAATGDDNYRLALNLTINDRHPTDFEAVLESVGDLAAENPSKIVLKAPVEFEQDLLKPILMGRRQVMKVRFIPADDEAIQLQLFLAVAPD